MMINVGDLVIKKTGGNKMKVVSIAGDKVECVWVSESFNQDFFDLKELLPYTEYDSLFRDEKRNDKISLILN